MISLPLSHTAMVDITDLGNSLVALPLAGVIACWLWQAGHRGLAGIFGLNVTCAVLATIVLKLVSRSLGGEFWGTPFHLSTGAPSGHAALAAAIYGGAAALFAVGSRGVLRAGALALFALAIIGVAVTRVTLQAHTPADVVTGLVLGGAFAALTALVARHQARGWPAMAPLLLGVVLTALVMQVSGLRLDSTALL